MSEHKKSRSSRSSSRRSSSRSSSRNSLKGKGADSTKSLGQRILEMLFGVLVGGALVAGLIWYFFLREPVEYVQRRENIENSVISGTVNPIADFATIRDTGTLGDMKTLLLALSEWPRDDDTAVKIDYQKKRIEIADKILAHQDLPDIQRELAIAGKMDALGVWFGLDYGKELGDPLIAEKYRAACKDFQDDSDPEIRREAALGKAKVLVFEYCKGNWNGTFAHIGTSILDLAEEYPDDTYVLSNINLLMTTLHQYKQEEAIELYRKLSVAYEGSSNPQIADMQSRLTDTVLLYESGINQLITGNWNNPENKEEIFKTITDLANNPKSGIMVFRQIGFTITGFENVGDYERTKKGCLVLKDSIGKHAPKVDKLIASIANDGLKRMAALNQPWSFEGVDVNGRKIDVSKFTDKVVVVLFWSPREDRLAAAQFSLLEQLNLLVGSSGVRFVTVQVEEIPGKLVEANPAWTNILHKKENPSNYSLQCPVNKVPYYLIVDRDGIVKEMHVSYEELKTKIDFYARAE